MSYILVIVYSYSEVKGIAEKIVSASRNGKRKGCADALLVVRMP